MDCFVCPRGVTFWLCSRYATATSSVTRVLLLTGFTHASIQQNHVQPHSLQIVKSNKWVKGVRFALTVIMESVPRNLGITILRIANKRNRNSKLENKTLLEPCPFQHQNTCMWSAHIPIPHTHAGRSLSFLPNFTKYLRTLIVNSCKYYLKLWATKPLYLLCFMVRSATDHIKGLSKLWVPPAPTSLAVFWQFGNWMWQTKQNFTSKGCWNLGWLYQ